MRILHIGGLHLVTTALARAQSARGHETTCLYTSGAQYPFEVPYAGSALNLAELLNHKPDLLQFHLPNSLGDSALQVAPSTLTKLRQLKSAGTRLAFYQYRLRSGDSENASFLAQLIREDIFDHIFLADPIPELSRAKNITFLPTALDFVLVPPGITREVKPGMRLSGLYCTPDNDAASAQAIVAACAGITSRLANFELQICRFSELRSYSALSKRLRECDLYIDSISGSGYGFLVTLAMLYSRAVVAPALPPNLPPNWSTCPLIPARADNLAAQIQALLVEPKNLRDLGRRARAFAEKNHNADQLAAVMLEVYGQLCQQV